MNIGPYINRRMLLKLGLATGAALSFGLIPKAVVGTEENKTNNAVSTEKTAGEQIGFVYDQSKCIGCGACVEACRQINQWDEGVQWRKVLFESNSKAPSLKERHLSISCNHCEKPACVDVCPVKAYTKRPEDGIVLQDKEKCIGCKYCLYACPYHAPSFSPQKGRISKCHFCYTRRDQGLQPACVEACPMHALGVGKMSYLIALPFITQQLKGVPSPEVTHPSYVIIPKKLDGQGE